MKNLNKRGGKGMLPACCLALREREGVTLLAAAENTRVTRKKRISTKPFLQFLYSSSPYNSFSFPCQLLFFPAKFPMMKIR
jgi:hypothetical protein